jgi:hypothetical protein
MHTVRLARAHRTSPELGKHERVERGQIGTLAGHVVGAICIGEEGYNIEG